MYFIIGGILALIVLVIGVLSITNNKVMRWMTANEMQYSIINEFKHEKSNLDNIIFVYILMIIIACALTYVLYPLIIFLILYFRYIHDRIDNRKQF